MHIIIIFTIAAMLLARHIPFLKSVFYYACTAFGGPTAHIGIMQKYFVEKRKDVTSEELFDIFSFCQLLPGPSSTQTVTLIGYKRGGWPLATLTLLIWILPAIILMILFAIAVQALNQKEYTHILQWVQPAAIGFLAYACVKATQTSIKSFATVAIMIIACATSVLFKSPWIFPMLIIIAGVITNLSSKRIIATTTTPKKIKWSNLYLFFLIFIVAGLFSEYSRINNWALARYFNLFENFYRFGSFTWGGGHALMPALYNQFIHLPSQRGLAPIITQQDFLTGFGLMNCVPGPVFSVSSFIGSIICKQTIFTQIFGGVIAGVAIFLPSILLVFFLYPIYNNLKQHVAIYRALEGIHATIVGVMWASGIVLFNYQTNQSSAIIISNLIIIGTTFLLLLYTKVPPPFIIFGAIALGFIL